MFLWKPSGKIRTVQDFRLLNSYLEAWRSVFPGTLETLWGLDTNQAWFTVLVLADGFWNMPVEEDIHPFRIRSKWGSLHLKATY